MTSISRPHSLISLNSSFNIDPLKTFSFSSKPDSSMQGLSKDNVNSKKINLNHSMLFSNSNNTKTLTPVSYDTKFFHSKSSNYPSYSNKSIINEKIKKPNSNSMPKFNGISPPTDENILLLDSNSIKKRNLRFYPQNNRSNYNFEDESEIDNESTCNECHGGGELICCDGCIRAYHSDCLSPTKRPRLDSEGEWFCPDCALKIFLKSKFDNSKNTSSNLNLRYSNTNLVEGRYTSAYQNLNKNDNTIDHFRYQDSSVTSTLNKISASNSISLKLGSKSNKASPISPLSKNSIATGTVVFKTPSASKTSKTENIFTSSTSIGHSPKHENISRANEIINKNTSKRRKKQIDEGPIDSNRINIGTKHQVPYFPDFFLNRDFSNNLFLANNANTNHSVNNAKLMFSPFCLERMKQFHLNKQTENTVVKNDYELTSYVQTCAQNWRNNAGWQPFSPEFAYKILHFAEYNPDRALELMSDPNFDFQMICDPPTRRYENKWKPKDRRGTRLVPPFPPTINIKATHSKRNNNSTYGLR